MEVIDALNKLGFSLWQVLILIIILMFRREIREIILRVTSLKIGGQEINITNRRAIVEELKDISSSIKESETLNSSEEIVKKLDKYIHKKYLGALLNIKNNTTDLWSIVSNRDLSKDVYPIMKENTYKNIYDDLMLLVEGGYFKFEILEYPSLKNYNQFFKLRLYDISKELLKLVEEVKQF
jgi:hypothetical protein